MKASDNDEIERLKKEGHTNRCACKIVWGDGLCECGKLGKAIPGAVSGEVIKPAMSKQK